MAASPRAAPITPLVKRTDLAADAAIAVGAFAVSLLLLAVGSDGSDSDIGVLSVALTALASLPLVARRRAPLGVFVLTALASVAVRAVAAPAGPPIGATLALFFLAADGGETSQRRQLVLGLAAALLLAHLTAVGLSEDRLPGPEALFGVVLWSGAWLAGDRTRLRAQRMEELEERAVRAEREAERERRLAAAEERTRIARDLHDSAGHAINVILVHAGLGRLRTESDPEGARDAFATIEDVARETVGEIDQLVAVLREDAQPTNGVEPPPGVAAVEGLVERHRAAGLDVSLAVSGDRDGLTPAVDRSAYRILQEALTNAARHGAGSADVRVAFVADALQLAVTNPVRPGGAAPGAGGHGIVGMRERAALLGGTLDVSEGERSFEVRVLLPLTGRR